MKNTLILRKTKDGYIFFNSDRSFRSLTFKSREEREKGIDKYIEDTIKAEKLAEIRRKKEWELTHS